MRIATWILLYVGSAAACLLVGARTPLGMGDALFWGGGVAVLVSVGFIGLGGDRKVVTQRSITGKPLAKEKMPPERRRAQINDGLAVFGLGLALWLTIVPVHGLLR